MPLADQYSAMNPLQKGLLMALNNLVLTVPLGANTQVFLAARTHRVGNISLSLLPVLKSFFSPQSARTHVTRARRRPKGRATGGNTPQQHIPRRNPFPSLSLFLSAAAGSACAPTPTQANADLAADGGLYFDKMQSIKPSPATQDRALATDLWKVSEDLTGFKLVL